MDQQNRPRARAKKVVEGGKGVEKRGEGLGTGPVNNLGPSAGRTEMPGSSAGQAEMKPQASGTQGRPSPFASQNPFEQQRPASSSQNPFGQQRPASSTQNQQKRPSAPFQSTASHPQKTVSGGSQSTKGSSLFGGATGNGSSSGGGCGGKLFLVIIALVVLLGGGKLSGLFDGGSNDNSGYTQTGSGYTDFNTQSTSSSGTQSSGQSVSQQTSTGNSLLDLFLNAASSTAYDNDNTSAQSLVSSGNLFQTSSAASETTQVNESVSGKARKKRTVIYGNGEDQVTILVYMCGTDLESQNGMGTSDLKEMASAEIGSSVNLIVYTGGCRSWRNNVVSSTTNQIYQIRDGKLICLEKNLGNKSMTDPNTLTEFIQYGAENFPANRMCLIFWDHGGGSVSGFGHDEKNSSSGSMTLAGINTALKKAGVVFDFVGFDACLMATVENAIMLSQYADYMIGSEETEPGVGWYYTNWLTKLNRNPGMPTVQIGKLIADDFVEVCNRKCYGQATTLSVVDLAELQATVPSELKSFSIGTNELIQNKEYKTVSTARAQAREFAQSTRIDQIDLVHFATNLNTSEGKKLAKAIKGAVKYNRTGGGISNANGLSIYFPYRKAIQTNKIVSTYQAIGMDEEYTRCIQEFASLEVSGQVAAGTPISSYGSSQGIALPGLLGSLLGSPQGSSSQYGSTGEMTDLFSGLLGGGGGSDLLSLFTGRSLTAEDTAEYISDNHFDAGLLVWNEGRITLPESQWSLVESLTVNVYVDDGNGFIEMGADNLFTIEGSDLVADFDNTWVSFNKQPVAYYYLNSFESDGTFVDFGYVPAILNGQRVNLMIYFTEDGTGYVAGAQIVYSENETKTQAKNLVTLQTGDRVQFVCNYFDYEGNYRDAYKLGDEIIIGDEIEIANTDLQTDQTRVNYCFTDIYQEQYWTPVI